MTSVIVDSQLFEDLKTEPDFAEMANVFKLIDNDQHGNAIEMLSTIDTLFREHTDLVVFFVARDNVVYLYTANELFAYNDGYMNIAIEQHLDNSFFIRSDF